jgi:P-type Ca2+ transporter type 2B
MSLFLGALDDTMLKILIVSAIVSLIIDMTFEENKATAWIEGAAILVAVFICSFVASYNDYQKEKQFQALQKISENNDLVTVYRNK